MRELAVFLGAASLGAAVILWYLYGWGALGLAFAVSALDLSARWLLAVHRGTRLW